MKDILDIKLRLGNVTLSLAVNRNEEATLREAARQVNHAWDGFANRFEVKKPDEIMAMVCLLFAKGYVTATESNAETARFLEDFETELDSLLLGDNDSAAVAKGDI